MKVSELAEYKRVVTCKLCGCEFEVANRRSHPKRCPACTANINCIASHKAKQHEGRRWGGVFRPEKKRVSNLDTLVREAKEYGLSYGRYVSLKAAGCEVKPQNRGKGINPAWQEWKERIYATVAACKVRAVAKQKGAVQ